METVANKSSMHWKLFPKLAELFPMFRSPGLEQELAEANSRIGWQKKRTERLQQRYDAMDRRCVSLGTEVDGLRSRLYTAQQQAEAFKRVVQMICASVGTPEDLKRIYEAAAPCLDGGGFHLFIMKTSRQEGATKQPALKDRQGAKAISGGECASIWLPAKRLETFYSKRHK